MNGNPSFKLSPMINELQWIKSYHGKFEDGGINTKKTSTPIDPLTKTRTNVNDVTLYFGAAKLTEE